MNKNAFRNNSMQVCFVMSRLGGFCARPVKKSCQMRTHHAARGLSAGDRPKQQAQSPMVVLERGDHLTGSRRLEHITHAGGTLD